MDIAAVLGNPLALLIAVGWVFFVLSRPSTGLLTAGMLVLAFTSRAVLRYPDVAAVDIASGTHGLSTLSFGVLVVALSPSVWKDGRTVRTIAVPLAGLALGVAVFWPWTTEVATGLAHLAVALWALPAGLAIGRRPSTSRDDTTFLTVMLMVVTMELVLELAQFAGFDINVARVSGTFGHANVVGKLCLISSVLVLPRLCHEERRIRQLALITLVVAFIATALTLSRSNTFALVGVFLVWQLFVAPGRRAGSVSRWWRVVGTGVILAGLGLVFWGPFQDRIIDDPEGGPRPGLLKAALDHMDDYWFTGTGPGNFTATLKYVESEVARVGQPVHNSLLLLLMELGLVAATCYAWPMVRVLWAALGAWRSPDLGRRAWARALVVVCLGVSAAAYLGWGFLQDPSVAWTGFVFGLASGRVEQLRQPPMADNTGAPTSRGRGVRLTGKARTPVSAGPV